MPPFVNVFLSGCWSKCWVNLLSEKFYCKACNVSFDSQEALNEHNKEVHGKPKKDDKKKRN